MADPRDVDVNKCFDGLSKYYEHNLTGGTIELKKGIEKLKAEGRDTTDKLNQWLRHLESLDGRAAAILEDFTRIRIPFRDNIKIGPWGGQGDYSFDIAPSATQITRVILHTGDAVEGLEISYADDRNEVKTYLAGNNGGGISALHEFELVRGEYINKMVGSVQKSGKMAWITKLGFKTNLGNEHGPFGIDEGVEKFTVPIVAGRIVGFFGEFDGYINSIGVSLALI
ncbi:protein GOS9-like [Curcuma longa]|uniref:protein GOS9-like n=1 Tax=Curcuma longa TaxID=136217 RepID=UPI003D9EFAE4